MHVQIFDKDTKPNNLMGEGVIDLTRVLREKEHDGYFPLQYKGRPNCGDIYLELTFYLAVSSHPPPSFIVLFNGVFNTFLFSNIQRLDHNNK